MIAGEGERCEILSSQGAVANIYQPNSYVILLTVSRLHYAIKSEHKSVNSALSLSSTGLLSLAALKKKNSRKLAKMNKDKDDEPSGNSELRALEAHMLKLSKQGRLTSALR